MKLKQITFLVCILAILLLLLSLYPQISQAIVGAKKPKEDYVPDELLIRFKPGTGPMKEKQILDENRLKIKDEMKQIKVKRVSTTPEALVEVEKKLSKHPNVDFVERNWIVEPALVPNDYYYQWQTELKIIRADWAWNISLGSENIKIVICDTGVNTTHPDLIDKLILPGWNFYANNDNVTDVHGHGTITTGAAAAKTNNTIGVSAIAWKPKVIPVKVDLDNSGWSTFELLSKCLVYAADRGAKVASMSYQIFNGSKTLNDAARYLMDKGGLAVGAGGNTRKFENYTDSPYIISVSGYDWPREVCWGSYGPYIDLNAPLYAFTTWKDGTYNIAGGTSLSAPQVAGLIAMVFSVNPNLTPQQVENILETTAVDLNATGYDIYCGWGRIDAYQALLKANTTPSPDPIPPFVSIKYPTNNQIVNGTVEIEVSATDNVGIQKVELYINNSLFVVDEFEPYVFAWDTTEYKNGIYLLQAKAYDTSGNSNISSIYVNVQNCVRSNPTVSITPISQWSPAGTQVSYTVTVTNNDALTCNASLFSLTASVPSGWNYSFESSSLTISPGSKASTSLEVTSASTATDGEYIITVNASSANYSGSASASYVVASSLNVTVSTNKPSYILKERVVITVKAVLAGMPVAGANINLTIIKPDGKIVVKTLNTDSTGSAVYNYRLGGKDPLGIYYVNANASKNSLVGNATTSFVVTRAATILDEIIWFFLRILGIEF